MSSRISATQLSSVLTLFMLGSAWLFAMGSEAKQSAWLAILLGTVAGLGVIGIYLLLQHHFPEQTMVRYIPAIIGPWLGKPVVLGYILYFFYLAARVTRDFTELTVATIMPGTPIEVITVVLVLLVAYAVGQGLEVLARASQVLTVLGVLSALTVSLLALTEFRADELLPVFEGGIGPLWKAVFPLLITVPWGEVIVFGMIWPDVERKGRSSATLKAAVFTGVFLAFLSLVTVGVMGSFLRETANFPLLLVVRQVQIGEFLTRLDVEAVLLLTLGGFMKVTVFFYGATVGLAEWIGLKDHRSLVLPLASCLAPLSLLIAGNYPEHVYIGLKLVPILFHIPLQILFPLLLLMIWELRLLLSGDRRLES